MDKNIRKLFTDDLLVQALAAYGIKPEDAEILDGFESFIYQVKVDDEEFILRIGHDHRRAANLVFAEADFLNYLSKCSLSVPAVHPTLEGALVSKIPAADGSNFITALFTKAPGHHPKRKDWTPELFQRMGSFLGRLHTFSAAYHPDKDTPKRYTFDVDSKAMIAEAEKSLPASDNTIKALYRETIDEILALPRDSGGFGLCHSDFHSGNFFVTDKGQITLFDFDDCQYAWYVYDIAMALFYAISMDCQGREELEKARIFLTNFLIGYRQEFALDPSWLLQIPLFLKLREIDLYIIIHRSMDLNNLDAWCERYMDHRREKILNKTPYCPLDYARL
ncbi:MAG: phosphotransferase [Anaerolineaceae bacterium]|nr:phosphotransferase [Anaerolineaceae bacterium]